MTLSQKDISKVLDLYVPGAGAVLPTILQKIFEAATWRPEPASPPVPQIADRFAAPGPREGLPAPPVRRLDQIFACLENLSLPPPIIERAKPIFEKAHYTVTHPVVKDGFNPKKFRPFTQATRQQDGIKLALINVPYEVYQVTDVWGSLEPAIAEVDAFAFVRFVSEDHSNTYPGFTKFLKSVEARGKRWAFTPWDWINGFLHEQNTVEQVFLLPEAGTISLLRLDDLKEIERKKIIELLVEKAIESVTLRPSQYLRNLAANAGWTNKELKTRLANLTDDASEAARKVVDLAVEWEAFDRQSERYGDSYLGSLLQALLQQLGTEKRKTVAKLIMDYNMVSRTDALEEVKKCLVG